MRGAAGAARASALLALAIVGLAGTAVPAGAAPTVPYSDPNANGYIGICNQQNQQITTGSIDSTPFAWKVVSSAAAPSAVSGTGRTATLYAYQPQLNLPAGYWSGEQITGTSQYSNPAHPMAVSTSRDFALSQFLTVFPPKWDGFIELRLFLGAPGVEPQVLTYPALNLHISGNTWQAVGGGSVDCTSGQAASNEDALPGVTGPGSSSSTPGKGTSGSSPESGAKGANSTGTGVSSTYGLSGEGANGATGTQSVAVASKSSNTTLFVLLGAAAVILIVIAVGLVIRGRRRASHP